MKISRSTLKEIIREEIGLIKETTIKTKSGHKIELSAVGSKLKISGVGKGYIEIKGHKDLSNFVNILSKNMGIH